MSLKSLQKPLYWNSVSTRIIAQIFLSSLPNFIKLAARNTHATADLIRIKLYVIKIYYPVKHKNTKHQKVDTNVGPPITGLLETEPRLGNDLPGYTDFFVKTAI